MSKSGHDLWIAAAGFADTPVRHRGRKPGKALDCAGVVKCAAALCGIDVAEPPRYGRDPDPFALLQHLESVAARLVVATDAVAGDILLFGDGRGRPRHFAITDGAGHIVHAEARARDGRVIVQALDGSMRSTLHSAWRLRGVL